MAKNINLLLVCLAVLCLSACKESAKPPLRNHHTLVLVDKSQSVIGIPEGFSIMLKRQLEPLFQQMIHYKGDNVQGYFIHGATTANQRLLNNVFPKNLPNPNEGGPHDLEDARDEYKKNLLDFQERTIKNVISLLEDKSTGDATRQTDVLGALELISNFKKAIPKEDTAMVIFISDMVHSQAEPRDYHLKPIKNKEEALACAGNDYKWLMANRKINTESFDNLKIHIVFPSGNYDMSQNDQMMYYWEEMLKKLNGSGTVTISRN